MIRSALITVLLCFSILFLPLWASSIAFVVALFAIPQQLWLFVPAVIADVLYAPSVGIAPAGLLMTFFVAVLLVVHWLIMTQTRIPQMLYGVATK